MYTNSFSSLHRCHAQALFYLPGIVTWHNSATRGQLTNTTRLVSQQASVVVSSSNLSQICCCGNSKIWSSHLMCSLARAFALSQHEVERGGNQPEDRPQKNHRYATATRFNWLGESHVPHHSRFRTKGGFPADAELPRSLWMVDFFTITDCLRCT